MCGKDCTICLPKSLCAFLIMASCFFIGQCQDSPAANPSKHEQTSPPAAPGHPQSGSVTMPAYVEFAFPAEAVLAEIIYPTAFIDRSGVQRTRLLRVLARGKFRLPRQARLNINLKPEALTNMACIQKLSVCQVTKIDANKLDFEDSHMAFLKDFTTLKELDLFDTLVTDKSLEIIGNLKALETLALGHTAINGQGFKYILGLNHLQQLHVSTLKLKHGALAQLKPLMPHIIRLNIGRTESGNEDVAIVQYLKNVQILDISSNPRVDNHAAPYLSHLNDLRKLNIEDTGISDKSLPTLMKIPRLETVYVRPKSFWSKGVINAKTGHIKILDVSSTSDMPLDALTPLH